MGLVALTAILLQVLSNLSNDLGDSLKGVDNAERLGPQRAVQSGLISVSAMKKGVILVALLSLMAGLTLLWRACGGFNSQFFLFLLLGLGAIAAALGYTLGSKPYGYSGLGDFFVLLFFGFVGVTGTAFLISGKFDVVWFIPATSLGLLAAAVLNLNNMRDTENDIVHGKMTLAARLGFKRARYYHLAIVLLSVIGFVVFLTLTGEKLIWISMIPAVLLVFHLIRAFSITEPRQLDPELKKVALTAFLISFLMFSLALTV